MHFSDIRIQYMRQVEYSRLLAGFELSMNGNRITVQPCLSARARENMKNCLAVVLTVGLLDEAIGLVG